MLQVLTHNVAGRRSKFLYHLSRQYHSHNGVFGYRPKPKREFQVASDVLKSRYEQSNFYRLVTAYREHAHKQAKINPISLQPTSSALELDLGRYGLSANEMVKTSGITYGPSMECSLGEVVQFLDQVYSGPISAEFNYMENEEEKEWFAEALEKTVPTDLNVNTKKAIATDMLRSQAFDRFMASKFATVKRYGAEGAESMMAFFHEVIKLSAKDDLQQIVLCMPHRGRLNLLTGMLNFPPVALFHKLQGNCEFPDTAQTTGDVISHLSSTTQFDIDGKSLHLTMLICPSHLEAVNSVAMGKTRARQQTVGDGAYSSDPERQWSDLVLNIQVHGDAAFTGQGINQETLNISSVPHFEIGGSVHLIVNNQVGFTTPGERGRSSRYSSDLAKMIGAPVIHVSGDDPEMVVKATDIAFRYQRQFRKDVFIDLNCFRRWGHNELDDPTFTNPSLYKIIHSLKSVPDMYAEKLEGDGVLTSEELTGIVKKHSDWLNNQLKLTDSYQPAEGYLKGPWSNIIQSPAAVSTWDTGVEENLLKYVGHKSVNYPEDFAVHPHLQKTHIQGRIRRLQDGADLDWATAEALAMGSLLHQGFDIRISGQDVGRGTFSHRHAMLIDQDSNDMYIPLNNLGTEKQGHLEVANSILSEEAVLGFEYGMSIEHPNRLAIWEAQFGDFFNGAQIQIDTFISSGETKWVLCSGLVMLLPHGYDGAGPEHSSCRLERFLQLTDSSEIKPDGDNVNMQVVNPTTPAQYFHLLRRQMVRNFRKPLIIAGPKTLLRLPAASSPLSQMAPGTFFQPVIGDTTVNASQVNRVIVTSGKHYYSLVSQREALGQRDVAIIRLEALSPFPTLELNKELEKYPKARSFIWSQEEPRNMGAWNFILPRFRNLAGRQVKYCGRPTLPAPAVGYGKAHQQQVQEVITSPFAA